jgi:signal transduction histidine kinase
MRESPEELGLTRKVLLELEGGPTLKNALSKAVQRTQLIRWAKRQWYEREFGESSTLMESPQPPQTMKIFENVLAEIFQNAAKYSDPKKTFREVTVKWTGRYLIIEDNGLGIASIEQAMKGSREHSAGVGEGLLGIRAQLDSLGFPFQLESEPGQWTRWTLDLVKIFESK